MLATTILPTVQAILAHCELRTLLMFKTLRDDKSVVTP